MPNPGEILYNHAHIAQSAADIGVAAQHIKSELDDLERYVKQLVSTWDGDASTNYQQAQAKWNSAANDINLILQQLARAVGDGNQHMADVDKAAGASWAV